MPHFMTPSSRDYTNLQRCCDERDALQLQCDELLAALKGMFEWQRDVEELMPDDLANVVLDAIAKAEGR